MVSCPLSVVSRRPLHATATSIPRLAESASVHALPQRCVPQRSIVPPRLLCSCANIVGARAAHCDLVSPTLVERVMLPPAALLAVCGFLARSDVARSRPWPPGCRGWHFQRCLDARGPLLSILSLLLPARPS